MLRYIVEHSQIDLTAFFLSDFSVKGYQDSGFQAAVEWDVPLLEGYPSVILPAWGGNGRVTGLRPLTYGLGKHLRADCFDALWVHGYAHPVNLRAMALAKSRGLKVFVRAESQVGVASGSPRARRVKEPLLRRLFGAVDAFLAIGSLNAEYYRRFGVPDSKIFSVPYAVDNQFFQQQARLAQAGRKKLRQGLGLQPGPPGDFVRFQVFGTKAGRYAAGSLFAPLTGRGAGTGAILAVCRGRRAARESGSAGGGNGVGKHPFSWASRTRRSCRNFLTYATFLCCRPKPSRGD